MTYDLGARAQAAADRYSRLLDGLKGVITNGLVEDPTNQSVRAAAAKVATDRARSFLGAESGYIELDTEDAAAASLDRASQDLGTVPAKETPPAIASYVASTHDYLFNMIGAQVQRDVSVVSRELQTAGLRIASYEQASSVSHRQAVAAYAMKGGLSADFKFIDRAGRAYKSTKHVRDQYRLQLLNVTNETYIHEVASAGHTFVYVDAPNKDSRFYGQRLALVPGTHDPLFSEMDAEIFHPSSDAFVTIIKPE